MSQIDLLTAPELAHVFGQRSDRFSSNGAQRRFAVFNVDSLCNGASRKGCAHCGTVAKCHAERLADFVGDGNPEAEVVWQWPAGLTRRLAVSLDRTALRHGVDRTSARGIASPWTLRERCPDKPGSECLVPRERIPCSGKSGAIRARPISR